MDYKWRFAERDALAINNILREHGIFSGKILDLMCGDGRIAINLSKLGHYVTGIDFSERFIKDAKKRAEEFGVSDKTTFICDDVRSINVIRIGRGFDAALLVWASLGYYTRKEDTQLLKRIRDLVRPNGLLIIFDIIFREDYEPFQLFSLTMHGDYVIYSHEKFINSSNKLARTWRIYKRSGNRVETYLGMIKMELILYTKDELLRILKHTGWKKIKIDKIRGIYSVIAQKA